VFRWNAIGSPLTTLRAFHSEQLLQEENWYFIGSASFSALLAAQVATLYVLLDMYRNAQYREAGAVLLTVAARTVR
jgi:hypothetical protein